MSAIWLASSTGTVPHAKDAMTGNRKLFEFRCRQCGELHVGSPSFSYDQPLEAMLVPEEERPSRLRLGSDLCVVDDKAFYIRAMLEIPIHGAEEPFCWGVWVSQSKESFDRYVETYDRDQSGDGSFGWLVVTMPGYGERDEAGNWPVLACDVRWGKPGKRPQVVPHACEHVLYLDFADGISWERAMELATLTMHG